MAMPWEDGTDLRAVVVTAMTVFMGQASGPRTGSATQSGSRIATKPPNIERAADPDARRARSDSVA